jgi:hypothetical protein
VVRNNILLLLRNKSLGFVILCLFLDKSSSVVPTNLVGFSISYHGHRVALFEEVFFFFFGRGPFFLIL